MLLQYILGAAFIAGGGNGGRTAAAATTTTATTATAATTTAFVPPPRNANDAVRTPPGRTTRATPLASSSRGCGGGCRDARDRPRHLPPISPPPPPSALRPRRPGGCGFGARPAALRALSMLSSGGGFYDDFEDFGELGGGGGSGPSSSSSSSSSDGGTDAMGGVGGGDFGVGDGGGAPAVGAGGDAVMRELRARMKDLSSRGEEEDDDDYEEEEDEEDEDDDDDEDEGEYDGSDSGSALPDLEGSTISSIDDLIGFAQARAREKAREKGGEGKGATGGGSVGGGGTWEDENWARPVPLVDEGTGERIDVDSLLEGGIVLIANPARFCSDLAARRNDDDDNGGDEKTRGKKDKFLGGLFDDPFPSFGASSSRSSLGGGGGISPALLAKFGITLPPSPDLGPDRRADLLPVVLLIDRDPVRGCRAVLMNRRTGNLMGDLPSNVFDATAPPSDDDADSLSPPPAPHPLSAFMIQPLWWAGSSPGGNDGGGSSRRGGGGGGISAIDMVHACPYVNGSVPLARSDGLYWGGSPVQAQEAMKDDRLERPLSGFDFKFYIQTTRWLPSQVRVRVSVVMAFFIFFLRLPPFSPLTPKLPFPPFDDVL